MPLPRDTTVTIVAWVNDLSRLVPSDVSCDRHAPCVLATVAPTVILIYSKLGRITRELLNSLSSPSAASEVLREGAGLKIFRDAGTIQRVTEIGTPVVTCETCAS